MKDKADRLKRRGPRQRKYCRTRKSKGIPAFDFWVKYGFRRFARFSFRVIFILSSRPSCIVIRTERSFLLNDVSTSLHLLCVPHLSPWFFIEKRPIPVAKSSSVCPARPQNPRIHLAVLVLAGRIRFAFRYGRTLFQGTAAVPFHRLPPSPLLSWPFLRQLQSVLRFYLPTPRKLFTD